MTTAVARLDDRQLRRLAKLDLPAPMVSFHLPSLHRTLGQRGAEELLQALTRAARAALTEAPWQLDERTADAMLTMAADAVRNAARDPGAGLAVYVGADLAECFAIPEVRAAACSVTARPDLLPAVDAVQSSVEFHLLVLAQHQTALFRCDRSHCEPVEDVELPASIDEAFWYEDREPTIDAHGGPRVGQGSIVGTVGGGSSRDLHKSTLERFVQRVDASLPPAVHDGPIPLVVAAVNHVGAMLRNAHDHRDLVLLPELGSPERRPLDELRQAAVHRLDDRAGAVETAALATYRELAGTGRTCDGLADVLAAGAEGRVEVLLVDRDAADRLDTAGRGRLADAVCAVLATGAQVVAVDDETIASSVAAATLRF